MNYIVIAIRDKKIAAFHPIQCVRAEGEAIRNFQDLVSEPNNQQFYRHSDDFELYRIGTFDDQSGTVTAEAPKLLASGEQLKMQQGITMTRN